MSNCTVLVSGLPKDVDKNNLQIYFQSKNHSGGGEIVSIDINRERDEAMIDYKDASVADRVIARTHEYKGSHLTVQKYGPTTDEGVCVVVSGFSDKCTKDALEVYFDNARRSGGGDVTDVQIKDNEAIVTFASKDVAKRVLSRTHEYQGCQLTVQEYKPPIHECSILVSGLSKICTKDALEMYFESTRRSGGGEVKDMQMKGNKAVVTFASSEVAKRVLSKVHEYQGCQLTVQEYKPSTDERAVVVVCGFSSKCTEDALHMYFENTRRSDGGDVNEVQMKGEKAFVTFASAEVAKRVLSRTHEYQGCKLTLREYRSFTDECTSVMVSGLSDKCTKDALEVYFENNRRSGGGDVTDVQMKGDKAVVTFVLADDAKRVLSRKHEYQGCQLTVQEYEPSTNECSILVSGLSNNFTKDAVQMYFENTRRSGGDHVIDVEMKGKKAVVTFASADVAKRVLSRTHEYQGSQLSAEEYKPSIQEERDNPEFLSTVGSVPTEPTKGMTHRNSGNDQWPGDVRNSGFPLTASKPPVQQQLQNEPVTAEKPLPQSRVVRVSGDPAKMTEDNLSIIFANKRKSGGGKIENINCMPKEGMADITFRSPEDAVEVARKKSLEFDGARFTMVLKKNISKDPKTFHVTGLSDISEEKFILFMERISKEKVENVLFGSNLNAIVTFGNPPDPEHIYRNCSTKTLEGVHLKIEQSDLCDCIEVTGLAPNTTKDTLFYYFDNPLNGGGKVEHMEMDAGKSRAWVYFEDPKVVNSVTKKHHILKEAKLKVVPFYPLLGESSKTPKKRKKEKVVKSDPQNMLFIKEFLSQEFDQFLQKNQVTYTWEEHSEEILLGCAEPKMDKKAWENSCEAVVAYIKQIRTDSIDLTKAELELFTSSGLQQNLQEKCKYLEVRLLENDGKISLRGPDAAVRLGKETVLQTMAKRRETDIELPNTIVGIVCSDPGKVFMQMKFKQANINAVFGYDSLNGTELMVTAMSGNELKTAVKLIKDLTSEESILLDDHQKQLIKSEKWKGLKLSIQQEMLAKVKEEPEACTLWIAGFKEDVNKAAEKVNDFFEENTILKQVVETESGRATYIFKHRLNAIQDIESSLKLFSVKIRKSTSGKSGTILVTGTSEGVARAVLQVKELANGIKDRKVDLETHGIKRLFQDQKGKILLSGVENNHNCIIELCKENLDWEKAKNPLESIYCYYTPEGKKISLYKGDLTKHEVDVVVNPVNEKVKLDGGVGKKILEKGGQKIQDECNAHVKRNGDLKCTETLTTGAGTLHCKNVVHAVSPKWSPSASKTGSKEQERLVSLLTKTVFNSLKKSETFSSIAIPAIGAGGGGFPVGICARALIEGALEYSKKNPNSQLSEIHFIDMKDSVIKSLHDEMKTRFGKESSLMDKEAPRLGPKSTIEKRPGLGNVGDDSNSLTTTHGMKVKIVVDDLARRKTHAIVNTVASDLDLSKNPCAKALSSAAGPGLQHKCKSKGSLSAGEMFVTDGYDLGCINVFHVVVPEWQNGKGDKMMRSLIKSCLKEADKKRFSSIAFPAIGTGNLGYPRDVVARAFFEEADAFKRENPLSLLHELQIVVFHKDQTSVQVFQNELENRKTKWNLKKKVKPQLCKVSSWNSSSPLLGPVRLEMLPGDITQEKTNAIVIPLTTDLKLVSAGKLGIVINEKGGPDIQKEFDKLGSKDAGSVICTSAGSLPSTKIFHLVFGSSFPVTRMTEILVKCFIKADALGIKSIAVPAIGTGKGGMNPKKAAKSLLSAVVKFAQGNPTSLNHIRIVVFPSHMITDFQAAIQDLSESKAGNVSSHWKGKMTIKEGIFGMGEDSRASLKSPESTSGAIDTASSLPTHEGKMWLKVFAANPNDLDGAEASIKELMKGNSREAAIEHSGIGKLTDSMVDRILRMQDLPNIEKIELDKRSERITICGDNSVVLSNARFAIYDLLIEKTEEEYTRRYAELLAENVQWHYMCCGSWEPYEDEINAEIEQAYKEKEPTIVLLLEEDNDKPSYFMIDFRAGTKTNLETDETTRVERKSKATGIALPIHWDPQPTDSDGKELEVCLVPLDPKKREHAKEYDDVKKAVEKTLSMNIVKIERVQNPSRYRAYVVKKHEMDNKNGSNEKKLFHGTAAETCKLINHKGFDRSYCGKNATAFGKGVYFARDALYSAKSAYSPPDASRNRYMYLASVLVGEYTKGSESTIAPPPKDPSTPTVTFDSVVNNVSDPAIYVVFHDDQNYPEYLITFK